MPNRVLRDWTDSERVNELSVHAERFFTRLIMKVDDFGRFTANVKLLKANLFPLLTDSIRETDISRWAAECEKAGLIVVYEVQSKPYVQINSFKQRLRQAVEKYPPPPNDGQLTDNRQTTDSVKRKETEVETETENLTNARGNVFVKLMGRKFDMTAFELLKERKMQYVEQRMMKYDASGYSIQQVQELFNEKYNFQDFKDENHLQNCFNYLINGISKEPDIKIRETKQNVSKSETVVSNADLIIQKYMQDGTQ